MFHKNILFNKYKKLNVLYYINIFDDNHLATLKPNVDLKLSDNIINIFLIKIFFITKCNKILIILIFKIKNHYLFFLLMIDYYKNNISENKYCFNHLTDKQFIKIFFLLSLLRDIGM